MPWWENVEFVDNYLHIIYTFCIVIQTRKQNTTQTNDNIQKHNLKIHTHIIYAHTGTLAHTHACTQFQNEISKSRSNAICSYKYSWMQSVNKSVFHHKGFQHKVNNNDTLKGRFSHIDKRLNSKSRWCCPYVRHNIFLR
jgi:hypothetical protein